MTEKQDQPHDPAATSVDVLALAQELQNAGWSLRRIADHLQAEGFPSPTRWKGKPTRWTIRTVKRILEQAPPQEQPSAAAPPPQPMTFTGPITLVATGTLSFVGPVTMHGPASSSEPVPPEEHPADSIVARVAATCGPHD